MGLDTSHDAFHGGYGSYLILRESLMVAAGYRRTKEYPPTYEWDGDPDFDLPENKAIWDSAEMGEIDEWPFDPVLFLWAHQDCDGIIKPVIAGQIADRISELLPKIHDATLTFAPAWADPQREPAGRTTTTMALQFAQGLRTASLAGEEVVFA